MMEDFRNIALKGKSKNTVDAYVSDLKQFLEFLNKDFEQITEDDIENYKKLLFEHTLKPKTVNRKLVSIRKYINYLNGRKDVEKKIFIDFRLIKIQKQEYLDELLNESDFERLVRAAEKQNDLRAIAIFQALYLTGARVSELIQIKVSNINNDTITIKGKGGKYRDLFIPDRLKEFLQKYVSIRKHKDSEYLFINENKNNGMSRQSIHNLIKEYAGKSKVKLSKAHAHSFRHRYAFMLIEKGLSLDEVADLLGHTDINATRIYTRKTKKGLMDVIKKL